MPHYKFHYFCFQDDAGAHYASLLEWSAPLGMGKSAQDAANDLKQFLRWRYEKSGWLGEPELKSAKLGAIRCQLRPAYEERQRRYPLTRTVNLLMPVALGELTYGGSVAVLPLLDERIQFSGTDDVESLVRFVVQSRLDGRTPQALSRYFPLQGNIGSFSIHVSNNERRVAEIAAPPLLRTLADPVGGRQARSLLGKAWQREDSVDELTRRLHQPYTNVLLVGEAGAGKSAVLVNAVRNVERLAGERRKAAGEEPQQRHRFWRTSAGRLIAGMRYLGQWEARMEAIVAELAEFGGCLCIESLADFVQTGGQGADSGLAAFCLPFLQRRQLQLVAEATPAELDACRRLLPGFDDLFQIQVVDTMSPQDSSKALERHVGMIAQAEHLTLDASDIADATVHLHQRFLPYLAMPGEASRFLSETLERFARRKQEAIGIDDVQRAFIKQTGLDHRFVDSQVKLSRQAVESSLRAEVMGQDDACEVVADTVLRFKAGMADPQRPLGVLLFCGPTGVGKTELARSLARYLFGGGQRETDRPLERRGVGLPPVDSQITAPTDSTQHESFIRLDMSEYSGPLATERLLRQASGELSPFLQRVRRRPFSVVLLDEVEKANPEVYDVLLNVFDEGRMMDEFGRVTYFRNAVIIMTSNLGATTKPSAGFELATESGQAAHRGKYGAAVREFFRPEFFNRIDAVVSFTPLSEQTIHAIAEKELRQIARREGLQRRGLRLQWNDAVVSRIAALGYDARYGARPLQRALETAVVDRLSRWLAENSEQRDVTLQLQVVDDWLRIEPVAPGSLR